MDETAFVVGAIRSHGGCEVEPLELDCTVESVGVSLREMIEFLEWLGDDARLRLPGRGGSGVEQFGRDDDSDE